MANKTNKFKHFQTALALFLSASFAATGLGQIRFAPRPYTPPVAPVAPLGSGLDLNPSFPDLDLSLPDVELTPSVEVYAPKVEAIEAYAPAYPSSSTRYSPRASSNSSSSNSGSSYRHNRSSDEDTDDEDTDDEDTYDGRLDTKRAESGLSSGGSGSGGGTDSNQYFPGDQEDEEPVEDEAVASVGDADANEMSWWQTFWSQPWWVIALSIVGVVFAFGCVAEFLDRF